jgi:hypothetical protein
MKPTTSNFYHISNKTFAEAAKVDSAFAYKPKSQQLEYRLTD